MMGKHDEQKELFSYRIDLDKRVRADHPLRAVLDKIDFTFVRAEVQKHYGTKGNVSVDPVIILKMMFLLFFDNVASERELMAIIQERLDYLWFLGYGLNDDIPNHSVLSKARKRWGKEVFESFFVRMVTQCVERGLVDGKKLHLDASFVTANASRDSVMKASPELIAAAKQAFQAKEKTLENTETPAHYEAINDRMISTTDPDAAMVRHRGDTSRPRYHHHRAIDNAHGVITAVETTPGSIAENSKLMDLVQQHQDNTTIAAETVVADSKYGTAQNYVACQKKGMPDAFGRRVAQAKPPAPSGWDFSREQV
jgi:transposase